MPQLFQLAVRLRSLQRTSPAVLGQLFNRNLAALPQFQAQDSSCSGTVVVMPSGISTIAKAALTGLLDKMLQRLLPHRMSRPPRTPTHTMLGVRTSICLTPATYLAALLMSYRWAAMIQTPAFGCLPTQKARVTLALTPGSFSGYLMSWSQIAIPLTPIRQLMQGPAIKIPSYFPADTKSGGQRSTTRMVTLEAPTRPLD